MRHRGAGGATFWVWAGWSEGPRGCRLVHTAQRAAGRLTWQVRDTLGSLLARGGGAGQRTAVCQAAVQWPISKGGPSTGPREIPGWKPGGPGGASSSLWRGPGCSAPISHPANPEYFCRELPSSDSCHPGSGPHPPGPTTEARLSPLAPTQHCPHHGHLPVRADSSALRAPASSRPPCWSQSDACSDTPSLPPGQFSGLCLEAPSWENPAAGLSHAPPTHPP